jgi:hypothetical protein
VYAGPAGGQPPCGLPATVHIATVAEGWGLVALASCDVHAGIARRAGQWEAEHQHQLACGLPGTLWTDDGCVIDDSGVEPEPELAGARELAGTR